MEDKNRVLTGKPWLFDTYLFSLKLFDGCTPAVQMVFDSEAFWIHMHNLPLACMNSERGHQIGQSFGKVIQCDVDADGSA